MTFITIKSANFVKACMMGLVATASFGVLSFPAHAQNGASVIQTSDQSAIQAGSGNTSVQGNLQTGVVTQSGYPFGTNVNGAFVGQGNSQNAAQVGFGNSSVQGSAQNANVHQSSNPYYPYYPSTPGINAANLNQLSGQSALQLGTGNAAVAGSSQTADINQR